MSSNDAPGLRKRPTKPVESLQTSTVTTPVRRLESLDVYPKVSSEFKVTTSTGGTGEIIYLVRVI